MKLSKYLCLECSTCAMFFSSSFTVSIMALFLSKSLSDAVIASKNLQKSSAIQNISVTLDRKATTLCRRVFRTIGWCSGNDLETVLFAMLCLVLLRGLLFATKVHKNSNSPKFPSSFVGVLTQYKKKG